MGEQRQPYVTSKTITSSLPIGVIEYVNNEPDVREYLINLRRDLRRKIADLDELIARLPTRQAR